MGVGSEGFLYGDFFGVGSDGLVRRGTGVGNKFTLSSASFRVNPMTPMHKKANISAAIPEVVLFIDSIPPHLLTATGVPF